MKFFGNHKHSKYAANRSKGPQRLLLASLVILVLAGGAFAVYKQQVKPIERNAQMIEPNAQADPNPAPVTVPTVIVPAARTESEPEDSLLQYTEQPAALREGVYNILLCGTDGDGYRTDTILIAHMNVPEKKTALLSIPRDTPIETGSGGLMKINSVYAGGGEEGLKRLCRTLNGLLGFPLDGYFLVDLDGFVTLVDAIGGVRFDVPQDMYYDDPSQNLHIDLQAGEQLLDGKQAMGLARFRKGYATQDIQRTKVQQALLTALAKQCLSLENLPKLPEYAKIFRENVTTNMTLGNMLYFAQQLLDMDLEQTAAYTPEGQGAMVNGGSYYPLFPWSILDIVNESFDPYEVPIAPENIHVITPDAVYRYQKTTAPEEPETPEEAAEAALPEEPSGEPVEESPGTEDLPETEPDRYPDEALEVPTELPDEQPAPPQEPELWNETINS